MKKAPATMTEKHCEELVERGVLKKTGEHEFQSTKSPYGKMTIRFLPDLPGLPVK